MFGFHRVVFFFIVFHITYWFYNINVYYILLKGQSMIVEAAYGMVF